MPKRKRKCKLARAEQILLCRLSGLEDLDEILKSYREFNETNPPQYFVRNRTPIVCHVPFIDYKPIIPSGAWLRKPWKDASSQIHHQRVLGGGRPIKTPRSKKVGIDEKKLKVIIEQYAASGQELSYRRDWPCIAKKYHGVKRAISRKKIDQLYNYSKRLWGNNSTNIHSNTSSTGEENVRHGRQRHFPEEVTRNAFYEKKGGPSYASCSNVRQSRENSEPYCTEENWNELPIAGCESNAEYYTEKGNGRDFSVIYSSTKTDNQMCYESVYKAGKMEELERERNYLHESLEDMHIKEESPLESTSKNELVESILRRTSEEICSVVPQLPPSAVASAFLEAMKAVACQVKKSELLCGANVESDTRHSSGDSAVTRGTPSYSRPPCISTRNIYKFLSSAIVIHKEEGFWQTLLIKETKSGRRLAGNWTDAVVDRILSKYNSCCTWKFNRNYVKVSNSRKQGPYIACSAQCSVCECPVRVSVVLYNEVDDICEITFTDIPHHPSGHLSARKITGSKRDEIGKVFEENHNLQPSDLYRRQLAALPNEKYLSGNRDGAGLSANTYRVIASRARKGQTKGPAIHENVMKLKTELAGIDEQDALKSGQEGRKFWGLIHQSFVSDKEMRIVLLDEPMITLYKSIRVCDTLFLDATGSIVKPVHGFNRILHYAIVIRHPFSAAPPLPIAEYITNEHTVESVSYFLRTLCNMERKLQQRTDSGKCKMMMDFSAALILATIEVYNKESLVQYINRTMRIAYGTAIPSEIEKTFISICSAHLMHMVKRVAKKHASVSQKHLALRFVGRMIHVETLAEAKAIFRCAYLIFMSPYVSDQLHAACTEMENHINTFKYEIAEAVEEVETCKDLRDSSNGYKEDCNSNEIFQKEQSECHRFWVRVVEEAKCALDVANVKSKEKTKNKYYCPELMNYVRETLLPTITLWSHLMWGDLSRFSHFYKNSWCCEITESSTNGHVERYFGLIKRPWETKIPVETFIKRKWEERIGFRRQFADGIFVNMGRGKLNRLLSVYKRNMNWLTGSAVVSEQQDNIHLSVKSAESEVEERWQPKRCKKRKKEGAYYQSPPKKEVNFSPAPRRQDTNKSKTSRRSSSSFRNFRKVMWNKLASQFSSYQVCTEELNALWKDLPDDEKSIYDSDPAEVCNECKVADSNYIDWVACDICNKWYHCDCVGRNPAMTETVPFYHCPLCMEKLCRSLVNYVYMCRAEVVDSCRNYVNVLIQRWSSKPDTLKGILEMQDNCPTIHSIDVRCYSMRGIINDGANCWLNSIIQVLCGSALKTFLPFELNRKHSLMTVITALHNELQKDGKAVPTKPLLQQIARNIGMPLEKKQQEDASEGYINILTQLFSDEDALFAKDNFTNTKLNLTICLRCQNISGFHEQEYVTVLDTIRCNSSDAVGISDLIWNEFFGRYELNEKSICPNCQVDATHDKLLLASFFLYRPNVAVFMIRRRDISSGYANTTRVIPELNLDLRHHMAGIDASLPVSYELCGLIVHKGISADSGHYICHIADENNAMVTIDDDKVMYQATKDVCGDRYTQKHVHMLFYARKDRCQSENGVTNGSWFVSPEDVFAINKVLLEDVVTDFPVSNADVRTIFGSNLVNDKIINSFMSNVADSCHQTQSCYTASSYFYSDIISGRMDARLVHRTLDNISRSMVDLIVIPIHHHGHPGHWTVAGIFQKSKIIVHCDSLHEINELVFKTMLSIMKTTQRNENFLPAEWLLLSPQNIDRQRDVVSCGIFACINAANLISFKTRKVTSRTDFLDARYWVAKHSLQPSEEKLERAERLEGKALSRWQGINNSENLHIQTTIPGGEMGGFFEKLRTLVAIRCKSAMHLRQHPNENVLLFEAPVPAPTGEIVAQSAMKPSEYVSISPVSDEIDELKGCEAERYKEKINCQSQMSSLLQSNIGEVWTFINVAAVESSKSEVLRELTLAREGHREMTISDRLQAFYTLDSKLFRRLHIEELMQISATVEHLELYDELFGMVAPFGLDAAKCDSISTKGLNSFDFTCMVFFPEVLWTYLKKELQLKDHQVTRYLYGNTCQLAYHPWLRIEDNGVTKGTDPKARKSNENTFPVIQYFSGPYSTDSVPIGVFITRDHHRFKELKDQSLLEEQLVCVCDLRRLWKCTVAVARGAWSCFAMLFRCNAQFIATGKSRSKAEKLEQLILFSLDIADTMGVKSVAMDCRSEELGIIEQSIRAYFHSTSSSNIMIIRLHRA